MELKIGRECVKLLLEHAKKERPYEAVAVLLGTREGNEFLVKAVRPVRNILHSTTEFHIDPVELYKAYLEAEERGLEVVGIFHSHPAPPRPSFLDMKYMKLNPVVWLIASSIDWSMRAFILKNGIKEVKLKVEKFINSKRWSK